MIVSMLLTMTSPKFRNGFLTGKRFLIQIHINLLKKFYFQRKRKYPLAYYEKHLGSFLDGKVTFKHHINNTLCKVNKGIGATEN